MGDIVTVSCHRMKNTFPKEERLCNKGRINILFNKGSSFLVYPYRVVYTVESKKKVHPQVLVSIPKKRIKLAVDRNKIKRQTREAYRLQKNKLLAYTQLNELQLNIAIQYIANKGMSYDILYEKIGLVLERLINEADQKNLE